MKQNKKQVKFQVLIKHIKEKEKVHTVHLNVIEHCKTIPIDEMHIIFNVKEVI